MPTVKIQSEPLSTQEALAAVTRPDCGAIDLFLGVVRDRHEGRRVLSISYTAYKEMAEAEIGRIAAEAAGRWPLGEIYVAHRVGRLQIGEASVLVAVSSPHRAEAFAGCRYVIDELKKRAPIWKEEFYETGRAWVASE